MLGWLDGLGVIDLTDNGFQEHVRKTKLRVVSSVNFNKWKLLMASKTTLREHNGAILRRRGALPTQCGKHRTTSENSTVASLDSDSVVGNLALADSGTLV